MKQIMNHFVLITLLPALLISSTCNKKNDHPKIVALQDVIDFGTAESGEEIENVYTIKNEGLTDLKIEKVEGS